MNTFTEQRLQEIQERGYEIDIAQLWGRGFHIWKRVCLPILLASILFFTPIAIVLSIWAEYIIGISIPDFFAMFKYSPEVMNYKMMEWQLHMNSFEGQLRIQLFSLFYLLIMSPVTAGYIKMCHDADLHNKIDFSVVFKYFSPKYYLKVTGVCILVFFMTSVPGILFNMLGPFGGLINYGWMIVISLFTVLTVPLVIFSDANPFQAIQTSFFLVSKNIGILIAFLILGWIFSASGFILCCIGLFFTMSYTSITYYLIYKQSIGFETPENTDDLLASPESVY